MAGVTFGLYRSNDEGKPGKLAQLSTVPPTDLTCLSSPPLSDLFVPPSGAG